MDILGRSPTAHQGMGVGGGMHGGRERDEDKEYKAKECAFRHVLRPNPSSLSLNLIAKTDLINTFLFIHI